MISCTWSSIIITAIFLLFIVSLSLWALSKSRIKNCCSSKTDFTNCKVNFGGKSKLDEEGSYEEICNK